MTHETPESRGGAWREIVPTTLLWTGAGLAFSLIFNYLLLLSGTLTPFVRSLVSAVVVPIVIGATLSILLGYSFKEIRRYRRELARSASYDQLTEFFNGTEFSAVVERRVSSKPTDGPRRGAFLIVNADNLRSINMRYGFNWGEQALLLVASTIRSSVRSADVVGRLGVSEFGIFLPAATEENARDIAQRIRAGIAQVYFAPTAAGEQDLLSVSLGGVMFEDEFEFEAMYRTAEQQLSNAESSGRIEISRVRRMFPPAGMARRTSNEAVAIRAAAARATRCGCGPSCSRASR